MSGFRVVREASPYMVPEPPKPKTKPESFEAVAGTKAGVATRLYIDGVEVPSITSLTVAVEERRLDVTRLGDAALSFIDGPREVTVTVDRIYDGTPLSLWPRELRVEGPTAVTVRPVAKRRESVVSRVDALSVSCAEFVGGWA